MVLVAEKAWFYENSLNVFKFLRLLTINIKKHKLHIQVLTHIFQGFI